MHMNKAIGLALLVAGIILLAYGLNSNDSITSGVSRAVTGSPTNKTLWLLVGGCAASVTGAYLTFKPSGRS